MADDGKGGLLQAHAGEGEGWPFCPRDGGNGFIAGGHAGLVPARGGSQDVVPARKRHVPQELAVLSHEGDPDSRTGPLVVHGAVEAQDDLAVGQVLQQPWALSKYPTLCVPPFSGARLAAGPALPACRGGAASCLDGPYVSILCGRHLGSAD